MMPSNPTVYLDDFARANFSGVTAASDFTPIVAAALASFDHSKDGKWDSEGGTLVMGAAPGSAPLTNGTYNFLTAALPSAAQGYGIEVNRRVRIVGTGPMTGTSGGRTQLVFAPGLGGVRFNAWNYPLAADGTQSGLLGASGWRLEDIEVIGCGGGALQGPPTAHGVEFNCGGTLQSCVVHSFPGWTAYGHGSAGDVPSDGCDNMQIAFSSFYGGGIGGLFIDGHDSNGVMALNCRFTRCPIGLRDNSLTGMQVIGGQFEANHVDIWANNPSAITTLVACYKESAGGNPTNELMTICGNAVVIGGTLATEILGNPAAMTADSVGGVPTVIGSSGQISVGRFGSADKSAEVGLGNLGAKSPYVMALKDNLEVGGAWPFRLLSTQKSGGFGFDHAATGNVFFTFLGSRALKANGFAADAWLIPEVHGVGGVHARGLLIGNPVNGPMIWQGVASSIPTSTSYPLGSVVRNAAVAKVGDPLEWVLVSRGGVMNWVVAATLQN